MDPEHTNSQPDVPLSFYILGVMMIASAAGAMSLRNLVHCALCLALSFAAMAGLFLQLHAPFAAFAQVLVYIGAVAILIVFAILLTRNSEAQPSRRSNGLALGLAIALLLGGAMVVMTTTTPTFSGAANQHVPTVRELGGLLMTRYIVPLQLIGVLLTAALIGAIIIAKQESEPPGEEPS